MQLAVSLEELIQEAINMEMYAMSDTGRQREINQDCFEMRNISGFDFYVVADGMGGHLGGEVASNLSIASFFDYLDVFLNDKNFKPENIGEVLGDAVRVSNSEVFVQSTKKYEHSNMGTTFTVVCIYRNNAHICHVGDSRVYLFREGVLIQKTIDHTYANELFLAGEITQQEAEESLKKHILTRALGTELTLEIDSYLLQLKNDDKILICSDGLSNMVKNFEIKNILEEEENTKSATERLINLANFYGGHDNITVILIDMKNINFIGGEI